MYRLWQWVNRVSFSHSQSPIRLKSWTLVCMQWLKHCSEQMTVFLKLAVSPSRELVWSKQCTFLSSIPPLTPISTYHYDIWHRCLFQLLIWQHGTGAVYRHLYRIHPSGDVPVWDGQEGGGSSQWRSGEDCPEWGHRSSRFVWCLFRVK